MLSISPFTQTFRCDPGPPPLSCEIRESLTAEMNESTRRGDLAVQQMDHKETLESYTCALQVAEKLDDPLEISQAIKSLSEAFRIKKQYATAAKILMCALKLVQNVDRDFNVIQKDIYNTIDNLEKSFLNDMKAKKVNPLGMKGQLVNIYQLNQCREYISLCLSDNQPVSIALEVFSIGISKFLESLLEQCYTNLGKPPTKFTILGLGSLSRREMSPYSDLEFAILIGKDSEKNHDYFRKLTKLLEFRVILLGETPIRILKNGSYSPVKRGFSFDDGGNTPLGKEGFIELIKSPKDLARCQDQSFYEQDLILANVLRSASYLTGNVSLIEKYCNTIRNMMWSESEDGLTPAKKRAYEIMKGHLIEFEPSAEKQNERNFLFNIKTELYRLPNFIIAALAEFFRIPHLNTWERIDILTEMEILHPQGAENLKRIFSDIMHLRILAHLHYQKECDEVFHTSIVSRKSASVSDNPYLLTEKQVETITSIMTMLTSLHRIMKEVCYTRNWDLLNHAQFKDFTPLEIANALIKLHRYDEAKASFLEGYRSQPYNLDILIGYVELLLDLKNFEESREYLEKLLAIPNVKKHPDIYSKALTAQARLMAEKGDFQECLELHQKAYTIRLEFFGKDSPAVATSLNYLGAITDDLNDSKQSLKFFQQALQIRKRVWGANHPDVADTLNAMIAPYLQLGSSLEALNCAKESYEIRLKAFGSNHLLVSESLRNLGMLQWVVNKDHKSGLNCNEQALHILQKYFPGGRHIDFAGVYSNRGVIYLGLKNFEEARKNYEKALAITIEVYGPKQQRVADLYFNLGLINEEEGNLNQAVENFEFALAIRREVFGDQVYLPQLTVLSALAQHYAKLENFKKALAAIEDATQLCEKNKDFQNLKDIYEVHMNIYRLMKNESKIAELKAKQQKLTFSGKIDCNRAMEDLSLEELESILQIKINENAVDSVLNIYYEIGQRHLNKGDRLKAQNSFFAGVQFGLKHCGISLNPPKILSKLMKANQRLVEDEY